MVAPASASLAKAVTPTTVPTVASSATVLAAASSSVERTSTLLNSSHTEIVNAALCLKHDPLLAPPLLFVSCFVAWRDVHSFPTRRSTDLTPVVLSIANRPPGLLLRL